MGSTVTAHLTFEEFERLPDKPGKQELLDGELIDLPPAKLKHNKTAHRIYERLRLLLQTESRELAHLGEAFHEMGYRFSANSWLQPYVSITHKNQRHDDYLQGAPALAIEVVSERNTANQIDEKVSKYLTNGASEVWVVYPRRRHVWVYKTDGTAEMHSGDLRSQVLGGAVLNLPELLTD